MPGEEGSVQSRAWVRTFAPQQNDGPKQAVQSQIVGFDNLETQIVGEDNGLPVAPVVRRPGGQKDRSPA